MLDSYAVIGNPIDHSKSPVIHAAFARQTGEQLSYDRILGDSEDFPRQVRSFFDQGGKGLNVTLPFKELAWEMAGELSQGAETAGAVNTLTLLDDGRLRGENTDGLGLVRDLTINHDYQLAGRRILLLGAGGASRGVLQPLLAAGPARLTIANRTAHKALALAAHVGHLGPARGSGLDELAGEAFDLIINGTSAGISGKVPQLPAGILLPGGWVYDMMYGQEPTAFVSWGLAQGAAEALDGLGMLVEQAAESFFIWRGVRPATGPVIDSLRNP